MDSYCICCVLVIIFVIGILLCRKGESFDIPVGESSAWGWNTGPGYGAGYGTGYAMWGIWPSNIPTEPWKPWMWARRPSTFVKQFTPVPQIDFTNKFKSNYNISIAPGPKVTIDGMIRKAFYMDKNRPYYFHVYTPGATLVITDGKNVLYSVKDQGNLAVEFLDNAPDVLYYNLKGDINSGGVIYLNSKSN